MLLEIDTSSTSITISLEIMNIKTRERIPQMIEII
jgi:hypothetical protein